jgi:hypothetical protein
MSLNDRVYNGSVLAKSPRTALHLIAAAVLLAGSMTNAPAIMVRNRNGAAAERVHEVTAIREDCGRTACLKLGAVGG